MSSIARPSRRLFAIPVLLVAVLASCGGEGLPNAGSNLPERTDAPNPEATEPPAPEPTAPPAPEPTSPPAEDPAAPADDPADDGDNTLLIILLIVGGIAILGAIGASLMKRPKSDTAPATTDPRRQLLSTTRWYHDQLSVEILTLPAAEAQQRWVNQRPRLDQLSIDLRNTAAQHDPDVWMALASSLDASVSSLDTALRVRSSENPDQSLVAETVATANQRRHELVSNLGAAERSMS